MGSAAERSPSAGLDLHRLQRQAVNEVVNEEYGVTRIQRFAQMRRKMLTLVSFVVLEVGVTNRDCDMYQIRSLGSGS